MRVKKIAGLIEGHLWVRAKHTGGLGLSRNSDWEDLVYGTAGGRGFHLKDLRGTRGWREKRLCLCSGGGKLALEKDCQSL